MRSARRSVRFRPGAAVDFVVVGSGAAGGIIAKQLATAGLSVVVLEQGPRIEPEQFEHDEIKTLFQATLQNPPAGFTFRRTESDPARPGQIQLLYHRLVGGGSVMFTANYWRFREVDRSEEHTSELQSPCNLVCRLLLEKKKKNQNVHICTYHKNHTAAEV